MCIVTAGGDDELHVDDVSDNDDAAADEDDDSCSVFKLYFKDPNRYTTHEHAHAKSYIRNDLTCPHVILYL